MSRIWEGRLHLLRGRLLIYVEPREVVVGAAMDDEYAYIRPLPFVVLRWERSWSWQYTRPTSGRR